MAIKTGIAPQALLETPPEIFRYMVKFVIGDSQAKRQDDWARLEADLKNG